MRIEWHIDPEDGDSVKCLIVSQAGSLIVSYRNRINLAADKEPVTRERFWKSLVVMRLTSLQPSGPSSPISQFARTNPFPLDYALVASSQDVERLITEVLAANDLKRFSKTIPSQLAENFQRVDNGGWQETLDQCNRLRQPTTWETEEGVVDYIDTHFVGFGPKQARNVLQALGLTRYEIPIDSRVTNWLNDILQFPVRLSSIALADVEYYKFVQSGIRELCEACDLFPCIFDAAVFSLKDSEGWQESDFAF